MAEDKKQNAITDAGAVELEESKLDQAAGGAGLDVGVKIDPIGVKLDPVGVKLDPVGWKLDPALPAGKKGF